MIWFVCDWNSIIVLVEIIFYDLNYFINFVPEKFVQKYLKYKLKIITNLLTKILHKNEEVFCNYCYCPYSGDM